jgi:hypothetical protein
LVSKSLYRLIFEQHCQADTPKCLTFDDLFERVDIIGTPGKHAGVSDELPASAGVKRGGDRGFDAELVRPVPLSLCNAFDLGITTLAIDGCALVIVRVSTLVRPLGRQPINPEQASNAAWTKKADSLILAVGGFMINDKGNIGG